MKIVGKGTSNTEVLPTREEVDLPTPDLGSSKGGGENAVYYFQGTNVLSDERSKKLASHQKSMAKKREYLINNIRSIYKMAENMPLTKTLDDTEEIDMLLVRHKGMANKTITISNVAIVFDGEGIASIHPRHKHIHTIITRQPGYQVFAAPPVYKSLPEAVKAPVVEVAVPVPDLEDDPVPDIDGLVEFSFTGELEMVPDEEEEDYLEDDEEYEEIPETLDFASFTKAQLQTALEEAKVMFKSSQSKSNLVSLITEVWEDLELRETLYDALVQEG